MAVHIPGRDPVADDPSSADGADHLAKSKFDIAREWLRASGWQSCIDEARHRLTHEGQRASLTESLKIARAEAVRQMDLCRNAPARWKLLRTTMADLDARLRLIDQLSAIDPAARKGIFPRALRACEPISDGRERIAATLALAIDVYRRHILKLKSSRTRDQ